MKYSFKFKPFSGRVKRFFEDEMGVVIEKEWRVICVYGTNNTHNKILCAIPLCPPKQLKGEKFTVEFADNDIAKINVRDLQIVINFKEQKCKNNYNIKCYGSKEWGDDVQVEWSKKALM